HIRTSFVAFRADQTVGQALEQLRAMPPQGRIVYFYVVDEDQRLQGVVPTRLMLLSPLDAKLGDIMIRRVETVPHKATVMQACEMFMRHKFLALPVVDEQTRLLGIVDIELYTDEVADIAERTSFEDLFQLVGVRAAQARAGSPLNAFRQRFPWLLCNVAGGILAAFLTGMFQGVLDRLIVLALFIPVVLALSESVGIQSVSLAIQLLHGDNLKGSAARAAIRRELLTGALLGLGAGPLVGLAAWLWKGQGLVALSVLASIFLGVTAAALIGMALPVLLHMLKHDPRLAAGPIALVAADLVTLLIYFNLARWMLL
ncbi:MAG TPA: magnesium transporter, partial [Isosphaeraceae bacterium]|nr:magnesium transporter [Isosphaeraceae bacterium]